MSSSSGKVPDNETASALSSTLPTALSVWTSVILDKVDQRARKLMEHYLESLDIRIKHYNILVILAEEGPLSQIDLSRRLQVDRTTMVFLIDELEQARLVKRCPAPADRRVHAVTLTEDGKAVLLKANEQVRIAEAEFLSPLSVVERDQLRALLIRLT